MKKNYLKIDLIKDVKREAVALKKSATPEEISRLDLGTLDPETKHSCIYGQMTSNCISDRAAELIFKCCKRYFHNDFPENTIQKVKENVNGVKISGAKSINDFKEKRGWSCEFLSSIETYILLDNSKRKELIAFLKDETKTLVL